MSAPILFFDIAGEDAGTLRSFYTRLFGWEADETGQFVVPVRSPIAAAFRSDPSEKRIYIGVDDVTAALEAVEANGGSIDQPRFEVPGLVVLGLFRDPAGNPMGLVELDGDTPRVP